MGNLLAFNISKERGTEKREVPQAELVADYGIMGDAHAGKWHRQVSLLSAEKIDDFRARGAQIDNGAFGENLIISGFDLGNLPLGTRFCIGDTILEMTQIGVLALGDKFVVEQLVGNRGAEAANGLRIERCHLAETLGGKIEINAVDHVKA